jgi:uncharacterized protein YjeT (DUF2065 family)
MRQYSEAALLVAGIALVVVGAVLMFMHQDHEANFQQHLLDKFGPDYHWRSVGGAYFGLGAIIVGAFLMTASALVGLLNRALDRTLDQCERARSQPSCVVDLQMPVGARRPLASAIADSEVEIHGRTDQA